MAKKKSVHYVNNADFSAAVVEYVNTLNHAKENNIEPLPQVPDYIAMCFMKICEGLSHKSNFVGYPYREELVMDAVENCLKAIENYNVEAATRTGKPNAFSYFTQISWFAFLRRIAKEKKQLEIKMKYMIESGAEAFLYNGGDDMAGQVGQAYVNTLRGRIDKIKEVDTEVSKIVKSKKRKKRSKKASSNLDAFIED